MELTRKKAIEEHRKMWNWIADKIENEKNCENIPLCKGEYLKMQKIIGIKYNCFLCEYAMQHSGDCGSCPVDYPILMGGCLGGLYYDINRVKHWENQAALARQIANLPERKE